MPFGDATGPMGYGPITGRAAGYCAGYGVPGYSNPIPGYGFGAGRGWGTYSNSPWKDRQTMKCCLLYPKPMFLVIARCEIVADDPGTYNSVLILKCTR